MTGTFPPDEKYEDKEPRINSNTMLTYQNKLNICSIILHI